MGGLTGLMDVDEFLRLKKDLWDAAGGASRGTKRTPEPTCKENLVPEDYATWTWANLSKIPDDDIARLANLQQYAGKNYVRNVKQPVNVLKLTEECVNMLPLSDYLRPHDKHDLTHSAGKSVLFDLNVEVFTRGSSKNSGEQLKKLKQMVCPDEEYFVTLISAPLSTVTLPEPARVKAGIPPTAMFYCFCDPLISTNRPSSSEALAQAGGGAQPAGGGDDSDPDAELVMSRMHQVDEMQLDMDDPFVNLLCMGGFLYFDHTYDIVAINSVSFRPVTHSDLQYSTKARTNG